MYHGLALEQLISKQYRVTVLVFGLTVYVCAKSCSTEINLSTFPHAGAAHQEEMGKESLQKDETYFYIFLCVFDLIIKILTWLTKVSTVECEYKGVKVTKFQIT